MNGMYYYSKDVEYANEWMLLAVDFAAKYHRLSLEWLRADFPLMDADEPPNWVYQSTIKKWKTLTAIGS